MDINSLHEHNREAYQKVMQHFNEGHQKACVVHATGTGKSYIINAVSDHFERVLIMTTNMFTIDQVRDTIKAESPERITEPTYMIYQGLLQHMKGSVDYNNQFDLIALDEFHHTGAELWGEAVKWIIEQNPDAKVLGTSATAIRHSDGGRDMVDEMFDGHCVSELSLGTSWARKILMAPVYIMAIEDSEEFYNKFIKKIDESSLLEDKKATYRRMAAELKEQYEMDGKAPDIIRKWLPSDSKRIIVFSKNIEEAKDNVSKVKNWMTKAGFTIHGVYLIHSKMSLDERKAQMNAFQDDEFRGIKLMVAVDILNEGVHVPRVDAVFMLRKTGSPTIHLQQMGRCMGTYKENGRRPVIFDFRNNVVNTRKGNIDNFFTKEKEDYDRVRKEENELSISMEGQSLDFTERENFPSGNNYILDLALMTDHFSEDLSNADWDANYAEAKIFFDEYCHFPSYKENEKLYAWAGQWWRNTYLKNPKMHQRKAEMLTAVGFEYKNFDIKWMSFYEECKVFFDEYGHFPFQNENEKLYEWARNWWTKSYLKNPEKYQEQADMLTSLGFIYQSADELNDIKWMKNYEECKVFFDEYGHFPKYSENKRLYRWARKWWKESFFKNPKKHQDKADMLTAIGFVY